MYDAHIYDEIRKKKLKKNEKEKKKMKKKKKKKKAWKWESQFGEILVRDGFFERPFLIGLTQKENIE